jgi:hypothetical protein
MLARRDLEVGKGRRNIGAATLGDLYQIFYNAYRPQTRHNVLSYAPVVEHKNTVFLN